MLPFGIFTLWSAVLVIKDGYLCGSASSAESKRLVGEEWSSTTQPTGIFNPASGAFMIMSAVTRFSSPKFFGVNWLGELLHQGMKNRVFFGIARAVDEPITS